MRSIDNRKKYLNRRQWLAMLGVGGAGALAGCLGDDDDDPDDDPGEEADDDDDDAFTADDDDDDEPVDEFPDVAEQYDAVASSDFETLNVVYNTEAGAGTAIGIALDAGYTFDDNNEVFPLLYEDIFTEDGGNVWTIQVRDNLEFSDPYGSCTADDFVYMIEELHQSETFPSANSPDWDGVNIEQVNEFEFQAELETAEVLWPETFDPLEQPVPQDLVEPYVLDEDVDGMQEDEELLEIQFAGNLGAYSLDEWQRDAGTRYSRNDDYYLRDIDEGPELFEQAPYFENYAINVIEEETARLAALETGEVDSAPIPPERFEEFDDMDDVDVFQIPQPFNEIISVNQRDNGWRTGPGNLFRIREFRQALAMAISKDELIEGVYRGLAEPHYTWQPRFSRWYPGDDDLETWGVDDLYGADVAQERAQEAFDRSEFDYHFDGDRMVTPDGDQVVLDIYHSDDQPTEELTAEFVAQELDENLGIEVDVEPIAGSRFGEAYWADPDVPEGGTDTVRGEEREFQATPNNPGPQSVHADEEWDMSLVFGLNTYPRNPLTNGVFFDDGATSFYNPTGWYPEFDLPSMWSEVEEAETVEEIQERIEDVFIELNRAQPYIMLLFDDSLTGYQPSIEGPIESFNNGWDSAAWFRDN